jgi:hypothetical protein
MDEFRARRVVDQLRDRGVNAHLLRANIGQYGVGYVPQIDGSEDFDEAQTVDVIARTDYDQPIARQRATAPAAPPLTREGGLFRRFLDGFRYR